MPNCLSSKDLGTIEDQLNHEALANQKAAAYAQFIKDPQLKGMAQQLAARHKQRYEALFTYLNGHQ